MSTVTGLISSINFKIVNSTPIETERSWEPIFNRWVRIPKFEKYSKNATLFHFLILYCIGKFLSRKPFVWSPKSVSQWNYFHFLGKKRRIVFLFWVLESKSWSSVRSETCLKVIDTNIQHHFFQIFSDLISIIRISIVSFKPVREHSTRNYTFSFLPVTTVFVPHRKVFIGKIKLPPD